MGANKEALSKDGKTALQFATEYGHFQSVKLLVEGAVGQQFEVEDGWSELSGGTERNAPGKGMCLVLRRTDALSCDDDDEATAQNLASLIGPGGCLQQ